MKQLCPITIANYFYKKYRETDVLKLNYLTYFSYCWFLKLKRGKKELTFEKPIKTKYGIMFPSIHYEIVNVIKERCLKEPLEYRNSNSIDDKIAKLLNKIWEIYGEKDGIYCSAISQKDLNLLNVGDYITYKIINKNYQLKNK